MKSLRGDINNFEIRTESARHTFQKFGLYVERKSFYFSGYTHPLTGYSYYELKSGRRICPIHLEKLISTDEWTRSELKCPIESCSYRSEQYAANTESYTTKFSEMVKK
jgi:hypothetical protein